MLAILPDSMCETDNDRARTPEVKHHTRETSLSLYYLYVSILSIQYRPKFITEVQAREATICPQARSQSYGSQDAERIL